MTTFYPENAAHIGFEGKEKIGSSRGYIWSRTFPLLENCLITGYGPDTFTYIFPQNDVLAKYYSYEQFGQGFYVTVDKPHNMYIQIFYSSGLIALLAFLGIVVFYLVDCFRLYALRREYRTEQAMGISVTFPRSLPPKNRSIRSSRGRQQTQQRYLLQQLGRIMKTSRLKEKNAAVSECHAHTPRRTSAAFSRASAR